MCNINYNYNNEDTFLQGFSVIRKRLLQIRKNSFNIEIGVITGLNHQPHNGMLPATKELNVMTTNIFYFVRDVPTTTSISGDKSMGFYKNSEHFLQYLRQY